MKINSLLKAFLIILIPISFIESQAAKKDMSKKDCYRAVKDTKPKEADLFSYDLPPHPAQQKPSIVPISSTSHPSDSEEGNLFSQDLLSNPDQPFQLIPYPGQQIRLTKTKKEEEQRQRFLLAFKSKNPTEMKDLVTKFPNLKEVRFTSEEIPEWEPDWEQESWSPTQFAAHEKDLELLNFFLDLDMDIRSRKKPGGESLENNPLHISFDKEFKKGIVRILKHMKLVPFDEERDRLIDEKDLLKQTIWYKAIKSGKILYVHEIGKHEPSGHVESYTEDGRRLDGLEIAKLTQDKSIKDLANLIDLANEYLKTKEGKYFEYKVRKLDNPHTRVQPPLARQAQKK